MASEKQIAANRANAQKSRGPRTQGGKARASRNATRHGLAMDFKKDPASVRSMMELTALLHTAGYAQHEARLLAESEVERRRILTARSKILENLHGAATQVFTGDAMLTQLQFLQRIERYEQRASTRRKCLFQQVKEKSLEG